MSEVLSKERKRKTRTAQIDLNSPVPDQQEEE